jgi:hypothetical protein
MKFNERVEEIILNYKTIVIESEVHVDNSKTPKNYRKVLVNLKNVKIGDGDYTEVAVDELKIHKNDINNDRKIQQAAEKYLIDNEIYSEEDLENAKLDSYKLQGK